MKYMKLGSKPDVFQTEGNNIRFVATELATDIVITVGEVKFYLHKFPLLSKSSRLQTLVASTNEESNDEIDISDIPGGPAAFEICAKFCYGMIVTLNAYNVLAARCAAEYLEMFETIDKGNLIYKIDVFLSSSIFRTWKDSIIVLQTTKSLLPWSENLKVINHCVDSIATKASIDPSEVEWSYTYNRRKLPSENGLDAHWNGVRKQQTVPRDWWVEDLCDLEMCLYRRAVLAIKSKGKVGSEVIGEALRAYAHRRLLSSLDSAVSNGLDCTRHSAALETIVSLLPSEEGSVPCSFLLKLLRAACLLGSDEALRDSLTRRIGAKLDEASVSDLLIPASPGEDAMLYDVGLVSAMLEEFMARRCDDDDDGAKLQEDDEEEAMDGGDSSLGNVSSSSSKLAIAKLVDGYLAEIARDPNLPLSRFVAIAEMAPLAFRPVHDGLYRAIDMYLKEHPGLSKGEKKRLCGLMDCKKLSPEASMHAVQNERLPLRVVVQVLFFEQVRAAAAAAAAGGDGDGLPARSLLPREDGNSYGSSRSAATTATEDDQWACGVPTSSDVNSFRSMSLANKNGGGGGCSGRSTGGGGDTGSNKNGGGGGEACKKPPSSAKGSTGGGLMPKKILSKLWSGKASSGENSSSDTSESPGSANLEETRSTPSRNTRHSVS
ncbi:BTB/POZ domain-containing protein NPY4-like [Oryza brachyantha]|uniref:NPH3 domain-containing protein n=1 Tax=Oryza brachyantha TaxID=4533 RepID=J3NEJ8_ORYBR|nr:BTB/POZ domain-containing protein NPY4-like [Oryza brachyantha]